MKIRWNRQNRIPLVMLMLLYTMGAGQLMDRYRQGECSLAADLAAGIERVGYGLSRAANGLSRLRVGSWLGNSWAPGSIGWTTAKASASEPSSTESVSLPLPAQRASFLDVETFPLPASFAAPFAASVDHSSQEVRLLDCGERPVVVLTRTEVVVVTAEFPRITAPQATLAAAPVPLVVKAVPRRAQSGCRALLTKSST